MKISEDIINYNNSQEGVYREICDILSREISKSLKGAECKVWHAHPVWFIEGNPLVGYSKRKHSLNLMFWSGQSFNETDLSAEGSFKAAEIKYNDPKEIDLEELKRWLDKSVKIQWNYRDLIRNKGKLDRII